MSLTFRTFQKPDGKWLLLDQRHNTYGGEFDTEDEALAWLEDTE